MFSACVSRSFTFRSISSLIGYIVSDILLCGLVSKSVLLEHSSLFDLTEQRSRTGRKGPYAGYYVQIQPGASFVGTSSLRMTIPILGSDLLHLVCPTSSIFVRPTTDMINHDRWRTLDA